MKEAIAKIIIQSIRENNILKFEKFISGLKEKNLGENVIQKMTKKDCKK
jgi:hypothetical protein